METYLIVIIVVASTIFVLALLRCFVFNSPKCSITRNMSGKTIIITGCNKGIGKVTAFDLVKNGARVIFACRNEERAKEALSEIKDDSLLSRAIFYKLDLSSFESVLKFVEEIKKKFSVIDILINNAGYMADAFNITKDGIEDSLQSNHLSHMLLTMKLLEYDMINKENGLIINVASTAHEWANYSVEELKKLQDNLDFNGITYSLRDGGTQYGNTKLGNIYFTQYLSEYLLYKGVKIKAACLHPGVVNTEFFGFMGRVSCWLKPFVYLFYPIFWFISKSVTMGAQTTLHLCYEDFNKVKSGQYYLDCRMSSPNALAMNKECRDEFIKYSNLLIQKGLKRIKEQV